MRFTFRNLVLIAAGAVTLMALDSCSKHQMGMHGPQGPIILRVSQAGTKAVIDDVDNAVRIQQMMRDCYGTDGQKSGGFGVHGFKEVNHVSTKLFDNVRVYPDVELGEINAKPAISAFQDVDRWAYSPLRYWDRNPEASYQFIAYFPWVTSTPDANNPYATSSTKAQLEENYDNKELTLHNIPNWQTTSTGSTPNENAMDFMTANRRGTYADDFSTGKVTLSFNHILSQLVVKAYYVGVEKAAGGVKIMGLTVNKSDINEQVLGAGTTDFKQMYYDARARKVSTTVDGIGANTEDMADTYKFFDYATGVNIPYENEMDEIPPVPTVVGSWLFIPHKWKDLKITVDRQIAPATEATTTEAIPVTLGAESNDYKTMPGKTYVITLLLNTLDDGIEVESVVEQTWTEHNVTRELYNL